MRFSHWVGKFRNAFRGVYFGAVNETSFYVHWTFSVLVIALAAVLRCSVWQWCLLILCIGMVISMELMNSAIEHLARGLCKEQNREVGKALDIASGAVLLASIAAALVGASVFLVRLLEIWSA